MPTPSCFRPGVRVEPKFDGDYTFNTGHVKSFTILDYTIFLLSLLIPTLIGFHQAWRGNTELDDYMLARRSMSYIPVGLSLLASFLSAITTIGAPAEIYEHDTLYVWVGLSFCIVSAASAHIYMPVFYKLKINSVYEYLELRFSRKVRTVGSCLFVIQMVVYMAIVLYAPSIAFNAVTGLNLWAAIVSVGLVCTLYVTVGGVRAVIWADSFQIFVMFGSALAMLFAAMATVGTTTMWESAQRTERVLFLDFSLNPTLRHSVWNLFFGGGFSYLALYVNQAQVHRCLTCRTLREVKIALWMSFPGHFLYLALCLIIGLYMGAFYENCDPLQAKLVANANELTPLFTQDILSIVPGLPGIYLAGVFSATLSTISSGLNSISMVILEDYIRVYVKSKLKQDKERLILQIVSVIFGFVCLEITFLVSKFGGILEAALTVFGVLAGPLLGLFSLGLFFPWVNEKGALAGLCGSIVFTFTISSFPEYPEEKSPITCVINCNVNAFNNISRTALLHPRATPIPEQYEGFQLYHISYMWYSLTACLSCIVIGLLFSFLISSRDPKDVDPRLIVPVLDDIFPFYYLPEHTKKYYRFGIDHEKKFEKAMSLQKTSTLLPEIKDKVSLSKVPLAEFPVVAKFKSGTMETEL